MPISRKVFYAFLFCTSLFCSASNAQTTGFLLNHQFDKPCSWWETNCVDCGDHNDPNNVTIDLYVIDKDDEDHEETKIATIHTGGAWHWFGDAKRPIKVAAAVIEPQSVRTAGFWCEPRTVWSYAHRNDFSFSDTSVSLLGNPSVAED